MLPATPIQVRSLTDKEPVEGHRLSLKYPRPDYFCTIACKAAG